MIKINAYYINLGMYSGIFQLDYLIGDFENPTEPYCDSVGLLYDFLTNEEMAKAFPTTAANDTSSEASSRRAPTPFNPATDDPTADW